MFSSFALLSAFNLLCTVQDSSLDRYAPKESQEFLVEFRIDLTAMKWCQDECVSTYAIASADEKLITLYQSPLGRHPISVSEYIDRNSGAYSLILSTQGRHFSRSGTCDRISFKPFPTGKF